MRQSLVSLRSGIVKIKKEQIMETADESSAYATRKSKFTDDDIIDFLKKNEHFLDQYIMNEVKLDRLESWMVRRMRKSSQTFHKASRKIGVSQWKYYVHTENDQILEDLSYASTKLRLLWELCNCISTTIEANGFNLYIVDNENSNSFFQHIGYSCAGVPNIVKKILSNNARVNYVVKKKKTVRFSYGEENLGFPAVIPEMTDVKYAMYQAITRPDGELVAIVEFYRKSGENTFLDEDEDVSNSYLFWGGMALHHAHLFSNMEKQRRLNNFLLAVVKSIFQDMISIDVLVIKIINFALRLVDADRASLFLVDSKTKELYATIFDIGVKSTLEEEDKKKPNKIVDEIRFPIGVGIAGQVALTGEILNVRNAYSDPRFNSTIDQKTGYKTESILCMPIFIEKSIIAVMQMINKKSGHFDKEDESAFELFSVYCGMALHNAKLYDKVRRSEQKYKVALEVLSYHNTCSSEEVEKLHKEGIPESIPKIDDYYFNPFKYDDYQKAKYAIYMFVDLFGLTRFDLHNLTRFVLTIKKNYRNVPYHNWSHGFSVANSMYSLIKHAKDIFRTNECLALFTGSLCHDLDHRGKNNKYMLDMESPLAAVYTTSTMEHHHFNQTVTILQQDGHNIFAKLSNQEYKQILGLIRHCILSTDLALFFSNKSKLALLLDGNEFAWNIPDHRMLVQAIGMTASDLSASAKPWDVQVRTVEVIFEEFYQQGEAERAAGKIPEPMMNRDKSDQQAISQVGFIESICIPCYSLLYSLIPAAKPLLDMCQSNLSTWKAIAEKNSKKKE